MASAEKNFTGDRLRCWCNVAGSVLLGLSLLLWSWRQPATHTPVGTIGIVPLMVPQAVRRAVPPVGRRAVRPVAPRAVHRAAAMSARQDRRVAATGATARTAAGVRTTPNARPCVPTVTARPVHPAGLPAARQVGPTVARPADHLAAVHRVVPTRAAVPTARMAATRLRPPTPAAIPPCPACRAACQWSRIA